MITIFSRIFNKFVILIGLISLLTACSSTKFIYVFVDELIKDEVTYFLDLDDSEKVTLNQQVSDMVTWHRTMMLPRYAEFFNNIADKLDDEQYSASDINIFLKKGRFLIEETVNGIIPYASKFLIKHQSVENIKFMEKI